MSNTYNYHHPSPISQTHHTNKRGFTIVELLIVIVVVAILAAISIVSYNGIQQRAKNTTTIGAAKQAVNAINMYIADVGAYPQTGNTRACLTVDSPCMWESAVTGGIELRAKLADYSTLAPAVPTTSTTKYAGIMYIYSVGRTFNGLNRPVIVMYILNGVNQNCQLSNVVDSGGLVGKSSITGSTVGNADGATVCAVSIDGPEA